MTQTARAELLAQYDTTVVSVLHPAHGWCDAALTVLERGRSAVVLTAWDPGFLRPTLEVNERANDRMRAELLARGAEVWRADGTAPDGSSHEPGWIAWDIEVSQACDVAAAFGQFAVFVYRPDGERLTIPCAR